MRLTLYTFLAVLLFTQANAQNFDVSGTITEKDTGLPILGANIIIKDTSKGEISDFDGNFTIKDVPSGSILQFSYVGFVTQEVVINSSSNLSIQMETDVASLDEVVVIGYGSKRKELVSGSFSTITAEKIIESNPTRLEEALQGNAAGVQVTANSGAPGSGYNIRIRGITTNGDNSPLVIVDGVILEDGLSFVDPNDIENLSIIKDASAAIYGVKGANGVVLITTKKGRKNRATRFNYNSYFAFQETSNTINLMNAQEYAAYVNETEAADGNALPYTDISLYGEGTNWQDELFTTAPLMSHSLNVDGGGERVTYSFGGNYFLQEGVIAPEKSNYERWTLKTNLGVDLTKKLKLNTFLLYSNEKRRAIPEGGRGSTLYYALNASPLTSVYDDTDGTGPSNGFSYIGTEQGNEIINPFALIHNSNNLSKINRFTGKIELEYDLLEDLKVTTRYNFAYADVLSRSYTPLQYYGQNKVVNNVSIDTNNEFIVDTNGNGVRDLYSTVYEESLNDFEYTWETFLNYRKSINDKHNFDVLLGASLRSANFKGFYGTGFLVGNEGWENAYLSNTQTVVFDEDTVNGDVLRRGTSSTGQIEERFTSVFGRIQYDFDGRYLFSGMLRRDASVRFGPNNRFGYFPSFSAGWVVSNEKFFNTDSFVNNLKIRGSWGITGNDKIGSYRWLGFLQGANAEATYPFGNTLSNGNAIGVIANPDLQWEENYQTNIGADIRFLDNKFDMSIDFYKKRTEKLLLVPEVSGLLGASAGGSSAPVVNAGTIENKGIDLSLNFKHDFSDDFSVGFGYNLTTIKNEVIEVNNAAGFIPGGLFGLNQSTSRMQTGQPIGVFYGLETDGIFQNQAEINAHATQAGAQPGDIRYRDVDGDGIVEFGSSDDQTVIGNPIPDVTMGFNLNLNYKNVDFSSTLYASIGNDAVRSYERFLTYSNKPDYYLDRWTGEGTSNEVPRASTNAANNQLFSSFYVEDASYLRINNVQLGYSLSESVLEKIKLSKLRLYVAVNNLYTFTKYRGYNPDVSNASPIGAGVDLGQYPQTRSFITGLNVTF